VQRLKRREDGLESGWQAPVEAKEMEVHHAEVHYVNVN
jgi:hypothetical protein